MKRLLSSPMSEPRSRRSAHSSPCSLKLCFLALLNFILMTAVLLNTHILQNLHLLEQDLLLSPGSAMMRHPNEPVTANTRRNLTRNATWSSFSTTDRSNNNITISSSILPPHSQSSTILIPEHPDAKIWGNLSLIWTFPNQTVPHHNNMTETDVNLRRIHPLYGNCPWTAQYRLNLHPSDIEEEEYWLLESLDNQGKRKKIGGDELYIMYHHRNLTNITPTAVAYARDQHDGTYRLEFHTTPFTKQQNIESLNTMGRIGSKLLRSGRFQPQGIDESGKEFKLDGGIIAIYMQYTCGLGTLHHPAKKEWRTGGAIMSEYHAHVPYPPQMQIFEPPNANKAIDLGRYRKVMMFGDSNLHLLFVDNEQNFKNMHFIRKPDSALHMRSMKRLFLPKIEWFANLTMYEDEDPSQHRYALMIGSACWDIVFPESSGPAFQNHLRAVRYMLKQLKYTFGPMGNLDIYWHSGFALHLYVAGLEDGWFDRRPLKYMSYHRSFQLYQKQVELLKQVGNVTLLDFMHTTYLCGRQYIRGDARHVMPKMNRRLLAYYYPNN